MPAHQSVDHDGRADQRERNKGQPNFWPGKVLRGNGANLRADGRARVHDQRDQDVHVAFGRMAKCSVTGRDDDLEKIGPDREVCRNSENVNHRGHPNVTGAAPEEAAE